MTSTEMITDFAVCIHEPIPDKPGYLRHVRNAKIADLLSAINEHLTAKELEPEEYNFSVGMGITARHGDENGDKDPEIPKFRWLVAFCVEGGSEGYYIHCGAILAEIGNGRNYVEFGICKTYSADSAYAIAREVQRFLTATMWN